MIKNKTFLEVKKGDRNYQFICEVESPVGEVYDALSEMRGYTIDIINKSNQAAQEQAPVNQEEK